MKKPPITPAQAGHQTVPEFISRPTPGAAIPIGFTNQNVSGHAGLVPFWGCLHWQRFHALLAGVRPHVRTSPKAIPPADLALGFIVIPPPCAAISRRDHCKQRTDPIGSRPANGYESLPSSRTSSSGISGCPRFSGSSRA
jgi:hypothetical protein